MRGHDCSDEKYRRITPVHVLNVMLVRNVPDCVYLRITALIYTKSVDAAVYTSLLFFHPSISYVMLYSMLCIIEQTRIVWYIFYV